MSMKLVVCPWWWRFLVLAATLSLIQIPMWVLLLADRQTGVWPVVLQAGAIGVVTAVLMTVVQQPLHRSVVAILSSLDRAQRREAIISVRRGPVPVDPVVLAAGIRLGTLILGLRKQTPRWLMRFQWAMPVVMLVVAVVSIATADIRRSVLYTLLMLTLAATFWFSDHTMRRTSARVELMQSQLVQVVGGVPLPEVTVVVPPPMFGRRLWLAIGATGLIIGITAGAMAYLQRPRTVWQCRLATEIVDTVLGHEALLLGKHAASPQGPTVTDYQSWSDQLSSLAAQVSRTDLAPPAQHIAELSGQATALIRQTQTPGAVQTGWNDAYFAVSKQILDETGKIQNICYRH
ncbi:MULTISPECIES: hypothetical protein [Mycobacteroides]|uniref:hypothetical protein n=1 Tax=Mycobacteroides sp. PCS013 TaxID=3074106 RepID=UPI0007A0F83D|nr:hypothetical protein Chelonae_p0041 [Mycobacterium sp. QIA-37]